MNATEINRNNSNQGNIASYGTVNQIENPGYKNSDFCGRDVVVNSQPSPSGIRRASDLPPSYEQVVAEDVVGNSQPSPSGIRRASDLPPSYEQVVAEDRRKREDIATAFYVANKLTTKRRATREEVAAVLTAINLNSMLRSLPPRI